MSDIEIKLVGRERRVKGKRQAPNIAFTLPYDEARYLLSKKWAVIVKEELKKPARKPKAKK